MKCGVCEKHQSLDTLPGGPVFRDSSVFVAHFPNLPTEKAHYGHFIIELSRHITSPSAMNNEEAKAVGLWTHKTSKFLETELKAEHVYVVRIGDKTPHLHFHIVPRFPETPKEVWGPLLFQWEGSRKARPEEMKTLTEKFKIFLDI